jgi:Uma2 family endonuclease
MEARMSRATSPPDWTFAEYARLPDDGQRHEVLDGEVLVTPSPGTKHQRIAGRLWSRLDAYVRAHGSAKSSGTSTCSSSPASSCGRTWCSCPTRSGTF